MARCLKTKSGEPYGPRGMRHPLEHFSRAVPLREVNQNRVVTEEPKVTQQA